MRRVLTKFEYKHVITAILIVAVIAIAFIVGGQNDTSGNNISDSTNEKSNGIAMNFTNKPDSSKQHVSNTPNHASILKKAPEEVSVSFKFKIIDRSSIYVINSTTSDIVDLGIISLSKDSKSMTVKLNPGLKNGQYRVQYSACGTDFVCEMGSFQFGIADL